MTRLGVAIRSSPAAPAFALARRLARDVLASTPVRRLASPLLAPHLGLGACLVYHRVHAGGGDGPSTWGNAGLSVAREDFDRQMAWLARHRRCLALDHAIDLLAAGKLPADAALVTLDDGYRDNLENAVPALERHGVPATIFVATGLVDAAVDPWWEELEDALASLDSIEVELDGQPRRFALRSTPQRSTAFDQIARYAATVPPRETARLLDRIREAAGSPAVERPLDNPMLTWDQVAELARHPLVTLGAHTVTHPPLRALDEADARREIEESRRVLEQRSGKPVHHFAYPYGRREQVSERDSRLAAAAGYRSAFTALEGHLHAGHAAHRFLLPRLPITRRDGVPGLRYKLSGWEAFVRNRGRRLITL